MTTLKAQWQECKPQLLGTFLNQYLLLALLIVTSCASESQIVDHSFGFDALVDSPGIRILDYRYGESKAPGARNPDFLVREGRSLQRISISGPMKRAESLYVKWQILSDGSVHEDIVDLRKRLPNDLTDWKVYFLVNGPQLYVYLISRVPGPGNFPPNGPRTYRDRKVLTIYP